MELSEGGSSLNRRTKASALAVDFVLVEGGGGGGGGACKLHRARAGGVSSEAQKESS